MNTSKTRLTINTHRFTTLKDLSCITLSLCLMFLLSDAACAQRQMEYLNRGLVAVRTGGDSVYVGWRLLGTDPEGTAFNLYRKSGNKRPEKVNEKPISASTNYIDTKADPG